MHHPEVFLTLQGSWICEITKSRSAFVSEQSLSPTAYRVSNYETVRLVYQNWRTSRLLLADIGTSLPTLRFVDLVAVRPWSTVIGRWFIKWPARCFCSIWFPTMTSQMVLTKSCQEKQKENVKKLQINMQITEKVRIESSSHERLNKFKCSLLDQSDDFYLWAAQNLKC